MSNKDDKGDKKNHDTARRIWLAGIGAYGRALTEAKGAVDDITGKSSEVFEDLVQKGEMLEKVVEYKGKEMLNKSGIKDFDINDRIKSMRERLSGGVVGKGNRVAELESEVEALKAKLEALQKTQTAKPAVKKAAPNKKPVKKMTTEKTSPKPKAPPKPKA
ncbi:poly(hydroxyalkanoate) granule associated protein phasin [Litorimonas taeanensis]|uniref:Poly(Hydroxyalkanoate) granule associated protein phasin n=1 Tax=Litorimonas taeanensis TaxID=568099 RepID=A0A420WJ75_9PROT|nr:phasin family protein [Litorimonas taeanensis]RKQ70986.1 poly(hydroxyalkanoate) granule associated protein phasin [Litorimonas taeanensis]